MSKIFGAVTALSCVMPLFILSMDLRPDGGGGESENILIAVSQHDNGPDTIRRAFVTPCSIRLDTVAHGDPCRWLMANDQGMSLCCLDRGNKTILARVDLVGDTVQELNLNKAVFDGSDRPRGRLSPDGARVAFISRRIPGCDEMLIVSLADGRVERPGEPDAHCQLSPPAWSPQGDALVYYRHDNDVDGYDEFSVWISEKASDGWHGRQVAPAGMGVGINRGRPYPPDWDASGRFVGFYALYETGRDAYCQDYVVSRDGAILEPLTDRLHLERNGLPGMKFLTWWPSVGLVRADLKTGGAVRLEQRVPAVLGRTLSVSMECLALAAGALGPGIKVAPADGSGEVRDVFDAPVFSSGWFYDCEVFWVPSVRRQACCNIRAAGGTE